MRQALNREAQVVGKNNMGQPVAGDDALSMRGLEHTGQDKPTRLEVALGLQGDFRIQLAPLRLTPLQAGVMFYLHRQREAQMTETAGGVGVEGPTLSVVVRTQVRKHWVTSHRTSHDRRVMCVRLTQRGPGAGTEDHGTHSRREA